MVASVAEFAAQEKMRRKAAADAEDRAYRLANRVHDVSAMLSGGATWTVADEINALSRVRDDLLLLTQAVEFLSGRPL